MDIEDKTSISQFTITFCTIRFLLENTLSSCLTTFSERLVAHVHLCHQHFCLISPFRFRLLRGCDDHAALYVETDNTLHTEKWKRTIGLH